jgi:hypothetical protein
LSVLAAYQSTDSDPVLHKRVVKTEVERFKAKLPYFKESIAKATGTEPGAFDFTDFKLVIKVLAKDNELKNQALIWGQALRKNRKNEDAAIETILEDPLKTEKMIGNRGGVGARASSVRIEFKNGVIVPKTT